AGLAGTSEVMAARLEEALAIFEQERDAHGAARASMRLGRFQGFAGRRDEAVARLERAFEVLSAEEPGEDLALLAATLSRQYWFSGDLERAAARADLALDIAEAGRLPQPLAEGLRAKVIVAHSRGHHEQAL